MAISATSLKVPRHLKARIDQLAKRSGESVHALMLRALEGHVEAAERYQAFIDDGLRADEAMQRSGLGYAAGDVHAYLEAKIQGHAARRPKPVRWRR
jgi:predicted transcriptional regulator